MVRDVQLKQREKNLFYAGMYPRILQGFLISLIVMIGLSVFLWHEIRTIPPAALYATTVSNQSVQLESMAIPNQSADAVLQWAVTAAVIMNTYDFVNYNQQIAGAHQFFTDDGWASFLAALQDSDNIQTAIKKKLIVSAVSVEPPVILAQGVISGVYTWRIQLIMLITYQSPGSDPVQVNQMVTMLVERVPTSKNPRGIGIAEIFIGGAPTPGVVS